MKTVEVLEFEAIDGKPGYVKAKQGRLLSDIRAELIEELKQAGLYDELDYFSTLPRDKSARCPLDYKVIACFAVVGGSEGHYIHVESQDGEKNSQLIFLGKTFSGPQHALAVSNLLTHLLSF